MYDYEPHAVLNHDYHKRHWTAQEMILAQKCYFLWGDSKLPRWCLLVLMFQWSVAEGNSAAYDRARVIFLWQMTIATQFITAIPWMFEGLGVPSSKLQDIFSQMIRGAFFQIEPASTDIPSGLKQASDSLVQVVRGFWLKDLTTWKLGIQGCLYSFRRMNLDTTPRSGLMLTLHSAQSSGVTMDVDRVFAMHAVLQPFGASLPNGDYSKTVEQVYEAATVDLMEWLNTIDTLAFACCKSSEHLPSWIVDWRKHPIPVSLINPLSTPEYMLCCHGKQLPQSHKAYYEVKDSQLVLAGTSVASIVAVSVAFPPVFSNNMEKAAIRERQEEYVRALEYWSKAGHSDETFSILSALLSPRTPIFFSFESRVWNRLMSRLSVENVPEKYKTLCPQHPDHTSIDSSRELLLYHALVLHDNYDDLYEEGEVVKQGQGADFLNKLIVCLSGTRLCTVASGKICLTNYSPQPGDVIVWFHSSSIPYIVHKVKEPHTYKLVGYCYFHNCAAEAPEKDRSEHEPLIIV
jgi:hypothetical protein